MPDYCTFTKISTNLIQADSYSETIVDVDEAVSKAGEWHLTGLRDGQT